MSKKWALLISVLIFSGWLAGLSQAAMILDTGPGPATDPGYGGWLLSGVPCGIAGKFTTTQDWTVTSVEGWMLVNTGGTAVAVIYNENKDNAYVPGTRRFSRPFTTPASSPSGWYGASPLNWYVPAGTYWVGIEVQTLGIDAVMYYPAANPLASIAFLAGDHWMGAMGYAVGYRIQGMAGHKPGSLSGLPLLLME